MNFFNEIDKVSYNKETQDPIRLLEYIKFADEKKQEKYLLFKFRNNINQIASSMKLEVKQYDKDNNLIEKTVFEYDNFKAKGQEVFVPNAKLKVNYDTDYIEARLLRASFESLWWNGESLLPIYYTEEKFEEEYTSTKQEKKVNVNYIVQNAQVNKGKRKTKYKDVTRSNRPKFPKVLAVILSIMFLAVCVFGVLKLKSESKYIHDNIFEYEIIDSDEIKIINYLGNNMKVTIPAEFKDYKISAIGSEAFKETSIRTLIFTEGDINISKSAFEGCTLLAEVIDDNGSVKNVSANAFKDCTSLVTIKLPNAVIAGDAFNNCSKVKELNVKSFVQDSIYSAFATVITLTTLEVKQAHITASFFIGTRNVHSLILSGATYVELDALDNISLKNITIDEFAVVEPMCLAKFSNLAVELNEANPIKKDSYLEVNPNLNISEWRSVSE